MQEFMAIEIPLAEQEKYRLRWEAEQERKIRYDLKHNRVRHDLANPRPKFADYRFVGWDGEAPHDTGYSLFGNSDGLEICHPHLSTKECFDLLLEAKKADPYTIHVWFGGRYDWDEIIRQDIPIRVLARLKKSGVAYWQNYRLREIPGKIYSITKDGTEVTLYEIHGWFHSPYVTALETYKIGTAEERKRILDGKEDRPQFLWRDIEEIREYFRLELKLMPPLMDTIREICHNAGFRPRGWYGPSALAKELLTRHDIKKSMARCPDPVNRAARFAFAGGRFEPFRGGIVGRNRSFDKNSAYMHAAIQLPDLAHGEWRHTSGRYENGKFAVYHIRYLARGKTDPLTPYPLFRRMKNGVVCWPKKVEGWYWSPEAETVKDDPNATFLEAWIFDESTSNRPFAFVQEVFRQRLLLQSLAEDNPSRNAEAALKWALAAIYGQLARVVGWDKKNKLPPPTHQLEWAGFILSHCRAEMYKLAKAVGNRLISIDTDSVTILAGEKLETYGLQIGKQLGQWKISESDGGVFFQNGVYFTLDDGEWKKGKTRGIEKRPKTPLLTADMLMDAIRNDKVVQLTPKNKYITIKMALNGHADDMGMWKDNPGNKLIFGGGGKRYHNRKMCSRICSGDLHVFLPNPRLVLEDPFNYESVDRKLPWLTRHLPPQPDLDLLWVQKNDYDRDEWEAALIENYKEKAIILHVEDFLI